MAGAQEKLFTSLTLISCGKHRDMYLQISATSIPGTCIVILLNLCNSCMTLRSSIAKSVILILASIRGFYGTMFSWPQTIRTSIIWITKEDEFLKIFIITHLSWMFFTCQSPLNANVFEHLCCILLTFSYHIMSNVVSNTY